MKVQTMCLSGVAVVAGAAAAYLAVGREPCLTWGATTEDVSRKMPGDDLLVSPDLISTRAVTIDGPPSSIWPWLVQMGSGRGGVYTYDWIEKLPRLDMPTVHQLAPD